MVRVWLSLIGMLVVVTLAWAQPEKKPPAKSDEAKLPTTPEGIPVIQLTVQPMPRLPPALKYRLLPDPRELTPDNAAPTWLRAGQMISQHRPGLTEQQDRWGTSELPLKD